MAVSQLPVRHESPRAHLPQHHTQSLALLRCAVMFSIAAVDVLATAVPLPQHIRPEDTSGADVSALDRVSCAVQMSSRHADLLARWTTPRARAEQPPQRAAMSSLLDACPSTGGLADHTVDCPAAAQCRANCRHTADDVAQAGAATTAAETPALGGHPSLTLRVTGEHGCGHKGLENDGGTSGELVSAAGSPSHSLSPAKRPHTPHQMKLGARSMSGSRA